MNLEARINHMIPISGVQAFVTPPTDIKGFVEWSFDNLGITLKTEINSINLSNAAINRLLIDVGVQAKELMMQADSE
jgi:hypothetical protein